MCNRINCQKIFIKNKNFSKEKLTKTFLQKSKDVKLIKTEVHPRPKQTDKRECFSTPMFLNIGVLEIFTTFNFIKKIQFYYTNLSKKRFQHRYFSVNIAKFLRTPFSQNTSRTPASICLSQTIRKSFISIFYAEKNLSWRDAIYNRYAITLAGA